jgi:hypothetical protein
MTKLSDSVATFLDPDLLSIIRIGLTSYFTDSPAVFPTRFHSGYSSRPYLHLIQSQSAIGWDHFLRGKFSSEWEHIQHFYAKRYNLLSESERWLPNLTRLLATTCFSLWELRNTCRHGHDHVTRHNASVIQATRDLTAMYSQRELVLLQDQPLFFPTLESHLKEPLANIRQWLHVNKPLIQFSIRRAKAQSIAHTCGLQTYFSPIPRIRVSRPKPTAPPPRPPVAYAVPA